MVLDKYTAKKTAELLLQIKAIKLSPKKPFKWASGWNSPIYCDNRIILSHPKIRIFVREQMVKQIEKLYGKPDIIAGVATGAIGIGMLVADLMNLPFIYIRPSSKKHGRKNQIEGQFSSSQKVVVIEDLISTGNSSLMAIEALRSEDLQLKGMLSIFTYGFEISYKNFDLFICSYERAYTVGDDVFSVLLWIVYILDGFVKNKSLSFFNPIAK